MKPLYKLTFFLLIPLLTLANTDPEHNRNEGHTKKKTINKEFIVSKDATLKIDNRYGNLDIVTWEENRIVFEITITVNGNNIEDIQDRLDNINVEFQGTLNTVSAKTKINNSNKKSWWKWFRNNNVNMKINYLVKMPVTNNVNLNNDYGSINLGTLQGHAKINCDYGKIITKELLASNNQITFDYTNNCYFEFIESGVINADYSGFTVAKTKHLDIVADYTNSLVEIAEKVTYDCDYGKIRVNNVNSFSGKGDYLAVILDNVYKNVAISDADYGSIKIGKMAKNAGNLSIDSDYVGIKIGVDPEYAFDFEIDLDYGGLKTNLDFEFSTINEKSISKYYTGYKNKKNSGNLIKINSDYGNVSFTEK